MAFDYISKFDQHQAAQVELATLLIEKSPEDAQQVLGNQIKLTNILISKTTPDLHSKEITAEECQAKLKECLVAAIIDSLIKNDKWSCRLLMRLILIFLKQASSSAK